MPPSIFFCFDDLKTSEPKKDLEREKSRLPWFSFFPFNPLEKSVFIGKRNKSLLQIQIYMQLIKFSHIILSFFLTLNFAFFCHTRKKNLATSAWHFQGFPNEL